MGFDLLTSTIISICSCITGVAAVVALIIALGNRAKAESKELARRVALLEEKFEDLCLRIDNISIRLDTLEADTEISLKAILAVLQHIKSGNNIETVKRTLEDVEDHLIKRKTRGLAHEHE